MMSFDFLDNARVETKSYKNLNRNTGWQKIKLITAKLTYYTKY